MSNTKHLALIKKGVARWNAGRPAKPDLSGADLSGLALTGVDLGGADLERADLSHAVQKRACLTRANLKGANLSQADMEGADLSSAVLRHANMWRCNLLRAGLSHASLYKADLSGAKMAKAHLTRANDLYRVNFTAANLCGARLNGARLEKATLVAANLSNAELIDADLTECSLSRANVKGADFTGARIYGAGIWDIRGTPKRQTGLVITRPKEPPITVDNLKVAQFVYLMLNNPDIRDVLDTITAKAVLILGRFSDERKPVLDALREALRGEDLTPIIFDFEKSPSRDVSETVKTLAGLAKFVVADVTDATEVRAELGSIVPDFPSLPVQPLVLVGKKEFVSLEQHLSKYPWVLPTFEYQDTKHLLENLSGAVIAPAEAKRRELTAPPAQATAPPAQVPSARAGPTLPSEPTSSPRRRRTAPGKGRL